MGKGQVGRGEVHKMREGSEERGEKRGGEDGKGL